MPATSTSSPVGEFSGGVTCLRLVTSHTVTIARRYGGLTDELDVLHRRRQEVRVVRHDPVAERDQLLDPRHEAVERRRTCD